ncbi:hypothetical protein AA103581_0618 [Gluconobacter wancherniae NBRC 103581]|nr:hypothetical protein AA103581_0618 [Gluconobacter wancherniae NBRC 103581]
MLIRQTLKCIDDFLPFKVWDLIGMLNWVRRRFRWNDQRFKAAPLTDIEAVGDGEQPWPKIRQVAHLMHSRKCSLQTVLHKVICSMLVTRQDPRIPSQGGYRSL